MEDTLTHLPLINLIIILFLNIIIVGIIFFTITIIRDGAKVDVAKNGASSAILSVMVSTNYSAVAAYYIHRGEFDFIYELTTKGFFFFSTFALILVLTAIISYHIKKRRDDSESD